MRQEKMENGLQNLACELFTLPRGEKLCGGYAGMECILHVLSGKALLSVGPQGGQQWKYPLDAYDTVWVPADTAFSLQNDGIGNLEISRYCYSG